MDTAEPDQNDQNPTPEDKPPIPAEAKSEPRPKDRKKRRIILLIVGLVILLGGGGIAFWLMRDKPKPAQTTTTTTTTNQTTEETKPLVPATIAYAHADTYMSDRILFWRPASGGDKTKVEVIPYNQSNITNYTVFNEKVSFVTETSDGTTSPVTIWYSKDGGKSYSKIYTTGVAKKDEFGPQVTSLKFSNNGEALVFALLPKNVNSNTVKEIDLSTKKVKDLFTVDMAGVFIEGYDRAKQQVYYEKGCYNCDGNGFNVMYVRDVAKSSDTTLYNVDKKVVASVVMNQNLTKVLRLTGIQGTEGPGASAPYTFDEFDVASKTAKTLVTIKENVAVGIGYRANDNLPYYSKGKAIYGLDSAGKTITLFEASKDIVHVFYVSQDQIIASSGKYEDYALSNYNVKTKKITTILNGDSNTVLFGVTLGN